MGSEAVTALITCDHCHKPVEIEDYSPLVYHLQAKMEGRVKNLLCISCITKAINEALQEVAMEEAILNGRSA